MSLHQTAGHCVKLVLERRRAVIERAGDPERHEDGLDATARYREELTEERLLGWHSWLFPNSIHLDQPGRAGAWRTGPTRVLPGPDPERVPGEMSAFLEWFNSPPETDGVIRAATAHLWFSAVHPLEDGNGRIARAITDMALARSQSSPMRLYSVSHRILRERDAYYRALENAALETTGTCDITAWLRWFAGCLGRAMDDALEALSAAEQNAALMEQDGQPPPQPQAAPGAGAPDKRAGGDHHRGQVGQDQPLHPGGGGG